MSEDQYPSSINDTSPLKYLFRDNNTELWGPRRDPLWIVIPITVCYVIIFICGVVGNVSTCFVIARNKHMHTATNYYLFSLAVSDLLLLVSGLTPEMYYMWRKYPYPFGEHVCVITGFIAETSTNATVLTITAFTVERYIAICHPFLSHTVSKLSRAIKFIVAIWLLAFCLALPQVIQLGLLYLRDEHGNIVSEEYTQCTIKNSIIPFSFLVSTLLFFITPMTLITILYILIGVRLKRSAQVSKQEDHAQISRTVVLETSENETHFIVRGSQRTTQHSKSTRRVVKMLVAVVVAFFICWAPFQAQRLYAIYGFDGENTTPTAVMVYKAVTYASGLLYYLSATVNPILYNVMSLKFRQAFKTTLIKCFARREKLRKEDIIGGSSGGPGGGMGQGRLHYAALSRRSSRTNNSYSSGNSFIDLGTDLTRRPLVVSFKRRSARTSASSLEFAPSPDSRRNTHDITFSYDRQTKKFSSPDCKISNCDSNIITSVPTLNSHTLVAPPIPKQDKDPCLEDIEIFQECQLKIQTTVRRPIMPEQYAQSCSLYMNTASKSFIENDSVSLTYVRKSFTVPCLVLH